MNAKLTLSLKRQIIDSAKDYAKSRKVSLSQLIENYLNTLIKKEEKNIRASPLVESLTGIIPSDEGNEYREDYYDYLNKKYS